MVGGDLQTWKVEAFGHRANDDEAVEVSPGLHPLEVAAHGAAGGAVQDDLDRDVRVGVDVDEGGGVRAPVCSGQQTAIGSHVRRGAQDRGRSGGERDVSVGAVVDLDWVEVDGLVGASRDRAPKRVGEGELAGEALAVAAKRRSGQQDGADVCQMVVKRVPSGRGQVMGLVEDHQIKQTGGDLGDPGVGMAEDLGRAYDDVVVRGGAPVAAALVGAQHRRGGVSIRSAPVALATVCVANS
jgi:hypothetical protein